MAYMLIPVDDFYDTINRINTKDQTFLRNIVDDDNPSDNAALRFQNKLFVHKASQTFMGGVLVYSEKFVGLIRALIGVQSEYIDYGTYILGTVIKVNGSKIDYEISEYKTPGCTIVDDATVSFFSYENSAYSLDALYKSYQLTKTKFYNVVKQNASEIYKNCDRWYVIGAILTKNNNLLKQIFADGISTYGQTSDEYAYFSILSGDISIFNTILDNSGYVKIDDKNLAAKIFKSRNLKFIKWYRRKYKEICKHDISLFSVLKQISSPIELFNYLVTIL